SGVDPNYYEDEFRLTPLHYAATYNVIGAIVPLVEAGANIHAVTADGETPLDVARSLNHEHIAKFLEYLASQQKKV
ncbi:MAG TPA: ankyrin repeat domain-containing protein, partial [Gammaproteobacteria bacterium]|nr:ankyrin repeat domain-containing protein [Gammaproteobacteria bacterium]